MSGHPVSVSAFAELCSSLSSAADGYAGLFARGVRNLEGAGGGRRDAEHDRKRDDVSGADQQGGSADAGGGADGANSASSAANETGGSTAVLGCSGGGPGGEARGTKRKDVEEVVATGLGSREGGSGASGAAGGGLVGEENSGAGRSAGDGVELEGTGAIRDERAGGGEGGASAEGAGCAMGEEGGVGEEIAASDVVVKVRTLPSTKVCRACWTPPLVPAEPSSPRLVVLWPMCPPSPP